MSNVEQPMPKPVDLKVKRIAIFAGIVVLAFLIGLIPMWLSARNRASERDMAQRQLRLSNLQLSLATAAISARRGEYEGARQVTSEFFTALHKQLDAASGPSDLTAQQREGLKPLLNDRDNLITLLARGDPASADRLADLYTAYRETMGKP